MLFAAVCFFCGLTPELSRPARSGAGRSETAKRARLERIVRPRLSVAISLIAVSSAGAAVAVAISGVASIAVRLSSCAVALIVCGVGGVAVCLAGGPVTIIVSTVSGVSVALIRTAGARAVVTISRIAVRAVRGRCTVRTVLVGGIAVSRVGRLCGCSAANRDKSDGKNYLVHGVSPWLVVLHSQHTRRSDPGPNA